MKSKTNRPAVPLNNATPDARSWRFGMYCKECGTAVLAECVTFPDAARLGTNAALMRVEKASAVAMDALMHFRDFHLHPDQVLPMFVSSWAAYEASLKEKQ